MSREYLAEIELDAIKEKKIEDREDFFTEDFYKLVNSIRQNGLLQPIRVGKIGNEYYIINGRRRLEAFKMLSRLENGDDYKKIQAIVVENPSEKEITNAVYDENFVRESNSVNEDKVILYLLTTYVIPNEKLKEITEERIVELGAKALRSYLNVKRNKTITEKERKLLARVDDFFKDKKISENRMRFISVFFFEDERLKRLYEEKMLTQDEFMRIASLDNQRKNQIVSMLEKAENKKEAKKIIEEFFFGKKAKKINKIRAIKKELTKLEKKIKDESVKASDIREILEKISFEIVSLAGEEEEVDSLKMDIG